MSKTSSAVSDVLSWEEFYKSSNSTNTFPPKKIQLFNRLIAHTKNFFLISAYGAFTPGYVMLITKKLLPSFSMVSDNDLEELKWFISIIKKNLINTYNRDVIYFEHGMCACVGGLDRAHLHFMTVQKNIKNNYLIKKINETLIMRRAGITSLQLGKFKIEHIHDITHIMNNTNSKDYTINGKQLTFEDIHTNLQLDNWPVSTRDHTKKGGHYVFFKTDNPETSFLTDRNFQTQLGRQIIFEIEIEKNKDLRSFYQSEIDKNTFANVWKWQEFSFEKNMLQTIPALCLSFNKMPESENKYDFKTFDIKKIQ